VNARDIVSEFNSFRRLAYEQFSFLLDKYAFQETDAKVLLPGMWVEYRNATSQVSVYFEYGGGMNITVGRLKNITGETVAGRQYALRDFLSIGAPSWKWKPNPHDFDEQSMREWLADVAAAVRCCADDVLRGEFEILEEVDRLHTERARQMYGPREF
jgi:hypothetical protein